MKLSAGLPLSAGELLTLPCLGLPLLESGTSRPQRLRTDGFLGDAGMDGAEVKDWGRDEAATVGDTTLTMGEWIEGEPATEGIAGEAEGDDGAGDLPEAAGEAAPASSASGEDSAEGMTGESTFTTGEPSTELMAGDAA